MLHCRERDSKILAQRYKKDSNFFILSKQIKLIDCSKKCI